MATAGLHVHFEVAAPRPCIYLIIYVSQRPSRSVLENFKAIFEAKTSLNKQNGGTHRQTDRQTGRQLLAIVWCWLSRLK